MINLMHYERLSSQWWSGVSSGLSITKLRVRIPVSPQALLRCLGILIDRRVERLCNSSGKPDIHTGQAAPRFTQQNVWVIILIYYEGLNMINPSGYALGFIIYHIKHERVYVFYRFVYIYSDGLSELSMELTSQAFIVILITRRTFLDCGFWDTRGWKSIK